MEQVKNFVGGQLIGRQSDCRSSVFSPATGQEIRQATLSTVHETHGSRFVMPAME
ncbi:hypothetical protein [Xenorhabdus bovienii]|uniref:hypothetical protein n=1 Tax=Xenorhabdus bovienii TaxID=40576 RepID=UPI000A4EB95C|nr:hypothetical protein [Xenorhabdus bovienii]